MIKKIDRKKIRKRKHARVRKHVSGTPERPRLVIYRSNAHIYCQAIDDQAQHTLVAASSLDPEIRSEISFGGNLAAAKAVGALIAKRCLEKDIKNVVFDRGGYVYKGRISALADAAREAGLDF